MAYIVPNSTIKILANVPIDPDYKNTLYFDPNANDASEQIAYFNTKVRRTFDAQSYQRHERNKCRLNVNADIVDDCNYMMFQNTAFSGKWFYAFITAVEYINVNVTEITFEIDQIQTWWYEYKTPDCFVERTHSSTDNIGDNIVPENVECGEYILNNGWNTIKKFSDYAIILMHANASSNGRTYDNVFSGCDLKMYHNDPTGRQALLDFLEQEASQIAAMVGMYMLPLELIPNETWSDGQVMDNTGYTSGVTINNPPNVSASDTLDGYTPKNKKMYTYPYNFLHVDNFQGGSLELRYEFFNQNTGPSFYVWANITQPVGIMLRPLGYKDSPGGLNEYYPESISIANMPMCSYSIDSYVAWLSQNLVPNIIKMVGSGLGGFVGGGIGGVAQTGISGITNLLSDGYRASIQGDIIKGNLYNGSTVFANNQIGFTSGRFSVNKNYAKMIDDYFTAFGYAQKCVMTPLRKRRSRFTYVKTRDCAVTGFIPSEAKRTIINAYNEGIRFWADTGINCGNLDPSIPNSILSEE